MKENPGIEVVSSNQYGGADVEGRLQEGGDVLSSQEAGRQRSTSTASSAPNESTTFAMLRVLQDNGWAGKVKFVGFDASAEPRRGAARRRTSTGSSCRTR